MSFTMRDYIEVANALGVEPCVVRAVAVVESGGREGLNPDGTPIILFEPHIFSRRTDRKYDRSHPHLSYKQWRTRPYPRTQSERWAQLREAAKLDAEAAYASASYGAFQIMGFNHRKCGYMSARIFQEAMHTKRAQLDAFIEFCKSSGLIDELKRKDWEGFAYVYNGAGYKTHNYDTKMAREYARCLASATSGNG